MSSFKRKVPSKQAASGTQVSAGSPLTTFVSTGIPSLDDILGGGLPLSCTMAIAAPDLHSSYDDLVQKYFISQGLEKGHSVILLHPNGLSYVKECMWVPNANANAVPSPRDAEDVEAEKADEKIKIAWRYEEMKQFQTTVSGQGTSSAFSSTLDLTCRMPDAVIDNALHSGQLHLLGPSIFDAPNTSRTLIDNLDHVLHQTKKEVPCRICIPSFGSLDYGDLSSQDVCIFLYHLRPLLARYPHACISIGLASHIVTDAWGGRGWMQKLGWLVDAFFELSAFSSNPALKALSPSHHGLLKVHTLPAPHTLVSPSDKHSVLRGLFSAAMSAGGSGENNLAFKCTRKRLIFETLHLDVEGGVTERRTTPATTAHVEHASEGQTVHSAGLAAVDVQAEEPVVASSASSATLPTPALSPDAPAAPKVKKPRKKVAFHSDRPDLYDF
ncbi:hypothetical protein CYLTODRAFT_493741 [Cylindrobasidium torrendii FP15055 ss-10]|uniref:Elongator complex protein 4 n=1 Tax=Cylindrobasidium torrendii FP15055 ss-10 TaxID=1314674 RepID=A0A0D7AZ41_9AGAR|nr:hypothetical protein CYLTODRAFT_493741 [Cylindrobasidium torrendii FP15055 ss-10]